MITFDHVSYEVEGRTIIDDVSFCIEAGEFVSFVGTNGAGKSTTMRLINGLLKPTSGCVRTAGRLTSETKSSEIARRVGFLFQNPDRQICCNTVHEELMFGFMAQKADPDVARRRVDAIVERFGFRPDAEPYLLNRGTRQLLALASVIVCEPEVVVLDEPTTGLDYRECEKVMEAVEELHERGTTIVMVCHDMEVVSDHARRVVAMTEGRVIGDGPAGDVLRDRDILRRAHLMPPQIMQIGMGLAARGVVGETSAVARACTVDEMFDAIVAARDETGEGGSLTWRVFSSTYPAIRRFIA